REASGIAFGSIDIVPAAVDPYVWRAERGGGVVTLTGYVPTVEARAIVLAKAAELLGGVRVVEHLRVADGDPKMDWIGAISFALGQLSRLGKGTVALTGRNYDIAGEALSTAAYYTLTAELGRTLPASMELRRGSVAPAPISPFRFTAVRSGGRLTLSGYVPTDEVAKAIVSVARPKFGAGAVTIRLELAGGAPDGLVDAVTAGLQALSRLDDGRLELTDSKLAVSGVAVSDAAATSIEAALGASMPQGFTLYPAINVAVVGDPLSGADCQAALRAEIGKDPIAFDGRATISPDSYGLVDRLAAIAQRCPAAKIEVAAHTDSAGGTRKNQAISEERAQAVVDRLVDDGVRRERLSAIGYGQSRPIASNSTPEGRAQNRRVELTVVGQ
ncbi:MAG: OmpA family protein, partial [Rhizobiales bacterium]|nr:OmpA family protein [Hyphomicrobiales bacterium]